MKSKLCVRCHENLPLVAYNKNARKPDGYQNLCRKCQSNYHKEWYQKTKLNRREQIRLRKTGIIANNRRRYLDYVIDKGCLDCGERDPRVLEFDHGDADKTFNISSALFSSAYKWDSEQIQNEIARCNVVCANCHRKRTSNKLKWFYEDIDW